MKRGKAGDENDVTGSLFPHLRQNGASTGHSGFVVHGKDFVPRRLIKAAQRGVTRDSGGADQQIDRPIFEVSRNTGNLAQIEVLFPQTFHCGFGSMKRGGNRAAQPSGSAGDDDVTHGFFRLLETADSDPKKNPGMTCE